MTRPIKGWSEQSAYTGWRHVIASFQRAGVVKKIKRVTHKRERRDGKAEARKQVDE